jgi:phosphatidylserine/phosphatidylglycerophosphate/cardiolipin synthase-like enzyme
MPRITSAVAIANNEVAFLAWELDATSIPGCLGFHIVREYLDDNDQLTDERPLASYVAFKGQRNPDWQAQNTTVWPVQKFNWRDLTLRKKRNATERRPDNDRVRYRIRAVGKLADGLEPVEVIAESHRDARTGATVPHVYEGTPIPLGYLTAPAFTNIIDVTASRPPFTSSFTNGILSTQFLAKVLNEDGTITPNELENHLRTPDDWLRNYLAGDVLPVIRDFFAQAGGRFKAALYELEDEELIGILKANAPQLDLILSDAGSGEDEDAEPNANGKQPTIYDTRNAPARTLLRALADAPGSTCTLKNRLFNGSGHIGHNKFVVWLDAGGTPRSVLTGSTNWTWSGVAGQSNNCIRIDNDDVAGAFFQYWTLLHADALVEPEPLNAKAKGANQGDPLKTADRTPARVQLGGGASAEIWFSPNMPGKQQPPSKTAKPAPPPPDMDRLFSLLRKAEKAIFFLVFMPSRGGINSIVSEAIALGLKDSSLAVTGAISDTQAMWGFEPSQKLPDGRKLPAWSPHVFQQNGISVVRATALTDKEIGRAVGDFMNDETLTLGRAIIHDKVLVIDPMDPEKCVVAFGSHNMGYKASYSNDENLVIVQGHAALAQAYSAHVLDVYDHYRFRAAEAENTAQSKKRGQRGRADPRWDGFLDKTDGWQARASHRMSAYFTR